MVADAILDVTRRAEIVLDPFCGSGTTILAAERAGRRGFGIELDPLYVDLAIARWQRMTGGIAHHINEKTFDQIAAERRDPVSQPSVVELRDGKSEPRKHSRGGAR